MAKKHKKANTKKSVEPVQDTLLSGNTKGIWKYLRIIWATWSVTATVLSLWLGYLALRPSVKIDYASHLIPENPISLPIKITNYSLLPIYNVNCMIKDDLKGKNNINLSRNVSKITSLSNKLSHNKSIDYVYNNPIYIANVEFNGSLFVSIEYQLPIISKTFREQQSFTIYQSKDGYIRWKLVQ